MAERRRKDLATAGAAMAASAVVDAEGREIWPDESAHPGEHLAEVLEAKGWTQTELARRIGRPVQVVNEIVNGVKGITPETSIQFGRALKMHVAYFWRLEANHRFALAMIEEKKGRRKQVTPAARRA